MSDLCFTPALALARLVRDRKISARELLEAHLTRIEAVNPALNAMVTLVADPARQAADAADERLARGERVGPLHGLPIAHKDLIPTRGIRTTYGSRVFADHVPDVDALIVERVRAAGAITIGKTNTPELGAGSQTFNEVFGVTRNPYDTTRTCGGSSGGSAVALAAGMVPLADGSDMGGSLRNPASFCNVVGLRPSPGRIPTWPQRTAWFPAPSVSGPMARTVSDVALLLGVMAGPDRRDPLSLDQRLDDIVGSLDGDVRGYRLAWSRDLGGLPVERAVTAVLERQRPTFAGLGCTIDDDGPDLQEADEIFRTWRAWYYALAYGELLATHREQLKDTVVWNIEAGQRLTGPDLGRMATHHAALHERVVAFMSGYDALVLPVAQVVPFDVTQPYVTEIEGVPLETYIDWMKSCYLVSVTGLPAISVPCGFTDDGLPVGVQLVGGPRGEHRLLRLAHAFEQATGFGARRPPPTPSATPPAR